MDIRSILPSAPIDSLSQTAPAVGKDDMFAKMMDRLMAEAAERKRDAARAAADPRDSGREPAREPVRPAPVERPPVRAAVDRPEPPRARDPQEAAARKPPPGETRSEAMRDAPRARDEVAAKPAGEPDKAAARTEAKDDAKDSAAAGSEAVADDGAAGTAEAADDTETPTDGEGEATAEDGSESESEGQPKDSGADTAPDVLVAIEADVTVTETVVTVITEDSVQITTVIEATAEVAVDEIAANAMSGESASTAADAPATDTAIPDDAASAAGTVDVAAEDALAAAQAFVAPDAPAIVDGDETAAKAKGPTVDGIDALAARAGAETAGAIPLDEFPNSDDIDLPDNLTELAAEATRKKTESSADGNGQPNPDAQDQKQDQQQATANTETRTTTVAAKEALDALKPAVEAMAAADADAAALRQGGPQASDPTLPGAVALDGVRGLNGADPAASVAHLRATRGHPNMPMGVPDQVSMHIQKNVKDGNDQFTINLRPDELGRIEIKLEFGQDGRVHAVVAADKPQTLELLMRDSRSLERALQDAGLKADSGSLSFNLRGDGNQGGDGDDRRGGSGRRGRGTGGDGDSADTVVANYSLTLAPGRVDFRV